VQWLRRKGRCAGDPSLRLKNGSARDDATAFLIAKFKLRHDRAIELGGTAEIRSTGQPGAAVPT
jgi:hypothetical protein